MNKASGGDGIPVELFQILKDHAVKMLHLICQQIWKIQQWPQDKIMSVIHSNHKERQCQRMFKLPHNCYHFTHQQSNAQNSPSEASIVCEPRTSRYMFKLHLEKAEEQEIKLPTSAGSQKKQENSRKKKTYFCLTDYTKACDFVDHNKLENS